jgi:hypothetical protein
MLCSTLSHLEETTLWGTLWLLKGRQMLWVVFSPLYLGGWVGGVKAKGAVHTNSFWCTCLTGWVDLWHHTRNSGPFMLAVSQDCFLSLGTVLRVILTTWVAEILRIMVQGQPGQKVHDPHLNQWLLVAVQVCCSSYIGKYKENGRPASPLP